MESFFIILLSILGVLSLIRILATFICSLINHGKDGYLGINSLQAFDYRFDAEFHILPTIKCYNLRPSKYLEFSLCWLWFEYYKCYYIKYENE